MNYDTDDSSTFKQAKLKEHKVVAELNDAARLFEEKTAEYGYEAYKKHGDIMKGLFPKGVTLKTTSDFNRFCNLDAMVGKINRIASNFHDGGHEDSCRDLSVFAAMMMDLDNDQS